MIFYVIAYKSFLPIAKDIGQPISYQSELIGFLKKVDEKVLLSRTFRPEYMAGVGRRVFDLVWTVCVEGNFRLILLGRNYLHLEFSMKIIILP